MRSGRVKKREIPADPIYKSKVVSRLINVVMLDGKKSVAESIVYNALEKVSQDRKEALRVFEDAVKQLMPTQEVRSRRVGGATYQVPTPLKHSRSEALALRWLTTAAKGKKGSPMEDRLYQEIKNASEGTGDAMRKKDETHRMAEANRAFAHFARY